MFNKLGRGAGRGVGKRPLAPPQPPANLHRPGGARLPVGSVPPSSRTRPGAPGGAAAAAAAPAGKEETFRLAPGELDFAAIIRLTPDLVEEIRRVEAQGGVARIKFDANSKNASNVIDVGGKEFSFDWARDDLCDIYEERRSGEEGDGLLVERGSAWRKLNVHRKFDESAKHVKMRSVEAERMSKSRKSIVLDPTNPSVKNKVNAMAAAAVEGSMRRMNCYNKKDTYSKRRKTEINQGPPKSVFKSGTSIITTKGVLPVSPMPSPPEKPGPAISSSPFGTRNSFEENVPLNINKKEIENAEKEMPSRVVHGAIHEVIHKKGRIGDQPMDLRNVLVSLLSENPKGMSYKALEKAVGEKIPNSVQKIENVIKNIAIFQSPGRYFLKPGVEVESSTRRTSESGSSPESTHGQSSAADLMFAKKAVNEDFEQQAQLSSKVEEECGPSEQIDIMQTNPDDIPDDKRVNDDREGKASSSESGSDSESDSDSSDSESDSGSQSRSRSRSKSKSPVESGSASSSDSESDKSSSSKEGSDVEVDIMTSEDEKEGTEHKTKVAGSKLSSSPPWRLSDGEGVQNDIIERDQEAQVASPPLDLNDFVRDDEIAQQSKNFLINGVRTSENPNIGVAKNLEFDPYRENSLPTIDEVSFSLDQQKQSEEQKLSHRKQWLNDASEAVVRKNVNERPSMLKDRSSHEQQVSTEKNSRTKNKRASGPENFQEKPGNAKKSKAASAVEVKSLRKNKDATISANSHYVSPNKLKQNVYRDHTMQTANNVEWGDINIDFDSVDYNLPQHRRSIPFGNTPNMQQSPDIRSSEQLGQRPSDVSGRRKNVDKVDKNSEGFHVHPDATPKDKLQKDPRNETSVSERFPTKNGREGDKLLSVLDSYNRKPAENSKDCGQPLHAEKSPRNGKGSLLRRELSDLELGEFREPPVEEIGGVKKQFERKSSFKSVENKVFTNDNSNLDIIKGRSAADALLEIRQQSPQSVKGGVYGNQEGVNRKVLADDHVDSTWPQQRAVPSQHQQSSRGDHDDSDVMFNLDKTTEFSGRIEMKTSQRQVFENAGANKKPPASMFQQHDIRHGSQKGHKKVKESKSQKSNTRRDFADQNNNSLPLENDINGGRRGSSSDDDNFLCSKYDKDEPELKGPIKDYLQYKEYTQEYREKYDCYCSLNKNLENTRNKFLKVGQELELAKGRDMNEYFRLVKQLKEMYQQYGVKHKQTKKVFILLHEELKTLKQRIKDFTSAYNRE